MKALKLLRPALLAAALLSVSVPSWGQTPAQTEMINSVPWPSNWPPADIASNKARLIERVQQSLADPTRHRTDGTLVETPPMLDKAQSEMTTKEYVALIKRHATECPSLSMFGFCSNVPKVGFTSSSKADLDLTTLQKADALLAYMFYQYECVRLKLGLGDNSKNYFPDALTTFLRQGLYPTDAEIADPNYVNTRRNVRPDEPPYVWPSPISALFALVGVCSALGALWQYVSVHRRGRTLTVIGDSNPFAAFGPTLFALLFSGFGLLLVFAWGIAGEIAGSFFAAVATLAALRSLAGVAIAGVGADKQEREAAAANAAMMSSTAHGTARLQDAVDPAAAGFVNDSLPPSQADIADAALVRLRLGGWVAYRKPEGGFFVQPPGEAGEHYPPEAEAILWQVVSSL